MKWLPMRLSSSSLLSLNDFDVCCDAFSVGTFDSLLLCDRLELSECLQQFLDFEISRDFVRLTPAWLGAEVVRLFFLSSLTLAANKLECSSLAILFSGA